MTSNFQPAPEDFDDVRAHAVDTDTDGEGQKRVAPGVVAEDGDGTKA